MQTDATPREPFTLGVLFRYKFTIFVVALFVILGGYVRIVTQPVQYEATARLAVRFTSEALAIASDRTSFMRLPLLEEEVKAYMVQIMSPEFISSVLDSLLRNPDSSETREASTDGRKPRKEPASGATASEKEAPKEQGSTEDPASRANQEKDKDAMPKDSRADDGDLSDIMSSMPPSRPTALEKFKDQFLRTYYDIRKVVLSVLNAVLFDEEEMLSTKRDEVMQIMSKLEVTTGTEASHIISIIYRNSNPKLASFMANRIASEFREWRRKQERPKRQPTEELEAVVKTANEALSKVRRRLYELTDRLGSPTMEEAVRNKYQQLDTLRRQHSELEVAKGLLEQGLISFARDLPLESQILTAELERELLNVIMRYEEQSRQKTEEPEFFKRLIDAARKHLTERREESIERDLLIAEGRIEYLDRQISAILNDSVFQEVGPEYAHIITEQATLQSRISQAEADLASAKQFNDRLKDENFMDNVTLWQKASVPSFPLPQRRGIKLFVVIVLGIFLGCATAVVRHHVRPKRARRAHPRSESDGESPLILLPDEGRRQIPKEFDLDISFPPHEVPKEAPVGKNVRG